MGAKRRLIERQDTYQYVPLLPSLCSLLSDPSILDEVQQCQFRIHNDGVLEDVCDGSIFKEHPLFAYDPYALQIIAFLDEVELCNPLGTHFKKHKLAIVLFTLGNIHPKRRSSLKVINLLIAATVPIVQKHGIDKVLEPLVRDLKILSTEGVSITVNGEKKTYHGGLLLWLGDNLSSNTIGGFKQSFSFSLQFCRMSYVTNDEYKSMSSSFKLRLRSNDNHIHECSLITGSDHPLHDHYSKVYGINRRTALLDIPFFSMFNGGLAFDIMHDILEGVASLEMSLVLGHCIISKNYITLDDYNYRLTNFDYNYTETNKPPPIASRSILANGKPLRISASQSLLLLRKLPFVIGDVVLTDDKNWKCLMLLAKVVDIVLCPWATANLCAVLKYYIEDHHKSFVHLYTESAVIPKFHFLLHYPQQILSVGPMVRTWNMRNVAKLNIFKQASRLGNFKNIAYSIAHRNQRLLCYELSTAKILDASSTVFGPCNQSLLFGSEPQHVQNALYSLLPFIGSDVTINHCAWVKVDGKMIKSKSCYIISGCDGLHPRFAKVLKLLVVADFIVLEVLNCNVHYFDNHFHAYVIEHSWISHT